jgi:hypothetical protein
MMLNTPAPFPTETFESKLQARLNAGWEVISDGPTGVQLRAQRKMKLLDKLCLIFGAVMLVFVWPLGLLCILVAIIDYYVLTKQQTEFLKR